MSEKTLIERLLDAGYPRENIWGDESCHHESDLYVYATPVTKKVIESYYKDHGWSRPYHAPMFMSATDGKPMYDCAFQYYSEETYEAEQKARDQIALD